MFVGYLNISKFSYTEYFTKAEGMVYMRKIFTENTGEYELVDYGDA